MVSMPDVAFLLISPFRHLVEAIDLVKIFYSTPMGRLKAISVYLGRTAVLTVLILGFYRFFLPCHCFKRFPQSWDSEDHHSPHWSSRTVVKWPT